MLDAFIEQCITVHGAILWKQRFGRRDYPFFFRLGSVKEMNIREASINIVPGERRMHWLKLTASHIVRSRYFIYHGGSGTRLCPVPQHPPQGRVTSSK